MDSRFGAGVKVPIAILGAEIDQLSPPALLKQFEEILAAKPEVKPLLLLQLNKFHLFETVEIKLIDLKNGNVCR